MDLKGITDGEFINNAALLGALAEDPAELLGRVARLPKDKQSKFFKNFAKRPQLAAGTGNSRNEAEAKIDQLPKEIIDGLINKRLQFADTRFYVVKDVSGKSTIDMFQGTDNKNLALGNLANQKLEKDNWFLLFGIIMVYGENAGGKESCDFGQIPPIIRNGEFEMEAGNKKIVGLTENSCFDTRTRINLEIGYKPLESTKWIEPQVEIKLPVKFTAAANPTAFLKVVFVGTSVIPF